MEQEQRLQAKRKNEQVKLTASLLNNLSVGIIVGGLLGPSLSSHPPLAFWYPALLIIAGGLHLAGREHVLSLRSDD